MINSFLITNHLGESLTLDMRSPEQSGFFIRSVSGLGPTKAVINSSTTSLNDGSLFNSAKVGDRNIVFSLGFMEVPTIEAVRQNSYRYFPVKKKIKISVYTDTNIFSINGNVESNEPDIFSRSSGCQISIICTDPFFFSEQLQTTVFSGTTGGFQFPFSNESLTLPLLSFGEIVQNNEFNIVYSGDSEVGIVIIMHAIDRVGDITFYNVATGETMFIDATKLFTLTSVSGMIAGDVIVMSTVKNQKSIYLYRDGDIINILQCLDRNTDWFTLTNGDNVFAYTVSDGMTNLELTVLNQVLHQGV